MKKSSHTALHETIPLFNFTRLLGNAFYETSTASQSFVTPAAGLRQILTCFGTLRNFEINFMNTAGVRRTKCGVKFVTPGRCGT